jgi:hypothetical protein
VTVTGVAPNSATTTDPFTVGQVTETTPASSRPTPVSFPVNLTAGDELHAPVTFTATTPGGVTGDVTFSTSTGTAQPVNVPLDGEATQTGLYSTNPSLTFQIVDQDGMLITPIPVGQPQAELTNIVNDGTTPQTITTVSAPAGNLFKVTGVPKPGTVIQPGQSFVMTVTYTPTRVKASTGSVTVTGSSGASATVGLNASSEADTIKITAPKSLDFGAVAVGHSVTKMINIANVGNESATVTETSLSGASSFKNPLKPEAGLPVNGGYNLTIPIKFTPSRAGSFGGTYTLSWFDASGTHSVTVPITGTAS